MEEIAIRRMFSILMMMITCSSLSVVCAQETSIQESYSYDLFFEKVDSFLAHKKHKKILLLIDSVYQIELRNEKSKVLEKLFWYKASALYSSGKHEESIVNFKKGLDLTSHKDTLEQSKYWQRLGSANVHLENKSEALKYLNKFIDNRKYFIDHAIHKLTVAYNDRGSLYAMFSEIEKSTIDMNQALSILYMSDEPNIELAGNIYLNIGANFIEINELDSAYTYFVQAENLYTESLPVEHYKFGSVNYNLATIEKSRGNLIKSKMHFQKCENNWRKNYGSNHPRIAIINIRKGDLYNILGDYENGLLFGSEALQSLKDNNIKTPRYHRSIHNNLAISYESLGLYEKALLHYDEAKEIIIVTYGDSSIHYFNNQYFRAETYGHLDNAEASISILESVLHKIDMNKYPFLTARCYHKLGVAYGTIKEYNKAHKTLDRAIEIYETKAYQVVVELPYVKMSKIELYIEQDELYKAKGIIDDLKKGQFKKVFDSPIELNNLELNIQINCQFDHLEAQWYIATYRNTDKEEDLLQAYNKYMEAIDKYSLWQYEIEEDNSILKLAQNHRNLFAEAIMVVEKLYQSNTDKYFESSIKIAYLTKNTILRRIISDNKYIKNTKIPDNIINETARLKNLISAISSDLKDANLLKLDSSVMVEIISYRSELLNLKQKLAIHINKIKINYPVYYKREFDQVNINIGLIQESLGKDEAVIEYMLFDSALYTVIIDKTQKKLLKSKFTATDKRLIKSLYNDSESHEINKEQSVSLYRKLYKPIEEFLSKKSKLVIIPDGILSYLPFEILIDSSGSYLITDKSIRYSWSIDNLNDNHTLGTNNSKLLGYCPVIEDVSGLDSSMISESSYTLRGSQEELKAISSVWNSTIFEGNAASEYSFKKECDGYQILHLSTHGVINKNNPLLSHLVFNVGKDTIEDGKLHSWEIYNLNLEAELVVLSACNTGTGKLEKSEGVQSLSRSFASAGISSTIMSLWEIPDYSTSKILSSFYQYLKKGLSKSKALQLSKLDYINNVPSNELREPYYWAGLVLVGSDAPIDVPNDFKLYMTLGIIGLLIFIGSWLLIRMKGHLNN